MRHEQLSVGVLYQGGDKNSDGVIVTNKDGDGRVTDCRGTVAAPSAKAGYAPACFYRKSNGVLYVNTGTAASCVFAPIPAPSHDVLFAGIAANGGGAASFDIALVGTAATDVCLVTLAASTNAVYLIKAITAVDKITVTLSGDPGANTKVNYQVLRAAV